MICADESRRPLYLGATKRKWVLVKKAQDMKGEKASSKDSNLQTSSLCELWRRKFLHLIISSVVDWRLNPRAIRISSVVDWRLIVGRMEQSVGGGGLEQGLGSLEYRMINTSNTANHTDWIGLISPWRAAAARFRRPWRSSSRWRLPSQAASSTWTAISIVASVGGQMGSRVPSSSENLNYVRSGVGTVFKYSTNWNW